MRIGKYSRETRETCIEGSVNIDGTGESSIDVPIGFLGHMLEAFAKHGQFDLDLKVIGDTEVDSHHTVEDTGYALGMAFREALGDRFGIERAGNFLYPMDEALAQCAVDLSGRPYVIFRAEFQYQYCGSFETTLTKHFFEAFARGSGANIAIMVLTGEIDHHKIEAIFKAFAKSLRQACQLNARIGIPSTKGGLDL